MSVQPDERRWVAALLIITIAMGMLDAVSLLHLGTFTGYVTGTVILAGVNLSRGGALAGAPLVALVSLLLGAVAGGRLVRRPHPPPRLVGDLLAGVGALVGLAAFLEGVGSEGMRYGVVAVLALAMGLQTSATRHAGVPDMALPAATMVLHGLAHDSRLAGGQAERAWRRFGVLAALLGGAAAGATLAQWRVWAGLVTTSVLILGAALVLRAAGAPLRTSKP